MVSTQAFPCPQCGAQGTWHPERQVVACRACGTTLDLPEAHAGPAHWFPLVERLRDAPENRRTWTPEAVTVACPSCGGEVTFRVGHTSRQCEACGTPLLRGEAPGDAPLAPGGVIPFRIGEADAEARLRAWAASPEGGRLMETRLEITDLDRTYVPYWQFSAHMHCPFRGSYTLETRDGQTRVREYGGTIDEVYHGIERGFDDLPEKLISALEPMPFDEARPYEARYLAGAVVQQYSLGLWDAWDRVHAEFERQIDRLLRMAGDNYELPQEMWPNWSRHQGRLLLAPVYVVNCVALDRMWTALVHGTTGQVVGKPPMTRRDKRLANTIILVVLAIVGTILWLLVGWLGPIIAKYPPQIPGFR